MWRSKLHEAYVEPHLKNGSENRFLRISFFEKIFGAIPRSNFGESGI